jgi:hypothetical protein
LKRNNPHRWVNFRPAPTRKALSHAERFRPTKYDASMPPSEFDTSLHDIEAKRRREDRRDTVMAVLYTLGAMLAGVALAFLIRDIAGRFQT